MQSVQGDPFNSIHPLTLKNWNVVHVYLVCLCYLIVPAPLHHPSVQSQAEGLERRKDTILELSKKNSLEPRVEEEPVDQGTKAPGKEERGSNKTAPTGHKGEGPEGNQGESPDDDVKDHGARHRLFNERLAVGMGRSQRCEGHSRLTVPPTL